MWLISYLKQPINSAPLVIFRIAFGALMFLSILRFILKGWVYNMYILPKVYFSYYGFEWVKPLSAEMMYVVFILLLITSLGILAGAFYKVCSILFFLLFTYVELIDKTNYLNHYYFISIIAFILIFLPANVNFSVDNKFRKNADRETIPRFYIFIIKLQLFLVYFFAGVAKVNTQWLLEAQPLKTWLPAFSHFHLIGQFMETTWIAFVFCWFGCIYDLLIGFFLFNKKTVNIAYVFVVIFHAATALFFNIGMFPYIMMTITIIFLKEKFHISLLAKLKTIFRYSNALISSETNALQIKKTLIIVFIVHFIIQVIMPLRYAVYSGNLFWTEQGYRFSWRVMLMEKAGTAFFYVRDKTSGREIEIDNKQYLTYMQEKMMATQPDMMVDYAKFLKKEFQKKGFGDPMVRAQSFVTLNGSGSREFIDPNIDLSVESNSIVNYKKWVKSY